MIEIHKEDEPIFSKKARLKWQNKLDELNNELYKITEELDEELLLLN